MSKVSVQQLLRPTDTCLFMIRGKLLGVNSNEERVIAIVKHEGSSENALFVFEVDNLGSLSVDMLMPIYGLFTPIFRSSTPAGCHVEINLHGETFVFLLPYDTHTALFFSQLTLAKDHYLSSVRAGGATSSSVEFIWLRGYETCRTGWDRFCKPEALTLPEREGEGEGEESDKEIQSGFPDNWPWGHIITPRADGRTDLAMCESLQHKDNNIDEFDPLRNQPIDHPPSLPPPSYVVTMETSSPQAKPRLPYQPHQDPFLPVSLNPFEKPVRPCLSETNISQLQLEHREATPTSLSPLVFTHSQETFSDDEVVHRQRSAKGASPSPGQLTPRFPRERPQGLHLETSPSFEITNPFQETSEEERKRKEVEEKDGATFYIINSYPEVEMVPRGEGERKGSSSSMKRHASMDDLDSISSERLRTGEEGRGGGGESDDEVLDYKTRRMRTKTSLTSSYSTNIISPTSAEKTSIARPMVTPASVPGELHHKTRQQVSGSHSSHNKSPKFFRKKMKVVSGHSSSGSDIKSTSSPSSAWVTRYHPGVLLLKGDSVRDCQVQRQLFEREDEFCERTKLTLFCGTWNVNGQHPMQRMDKWLMSRLPLPDIFAIGFQELDLSPEALLRNDSNREEPWTDLVESSLKMAGKFTQICTVRLVGILLLVYVKEELVPHVSDICSDYVPCGIGGLIGHLGNKGGVAIRFNVHHSSICIVNSHLAAHIDEVEKRNQNYHDIYAKLHFNTTKDMTYSITDHNFVIWLGDLNYRIQTSPEMTSEIIKALADHYQFSKLLKSDQLLQQQKKGEVFNQFREPTIDFKPTYKFDPSTNSWDSSEKNRAPAWCDRVLYYCENEDTIKNLSYLSHPEMIISDHKPVSATFELQVKVVIPEKEKITVDDISKYLDKVENDTLPQVELKSHDFNFEKVKFMVEKSQVLSVRNTGRRPVQLRFKEVAQEDGSMRMCKPWLSIKPDKAIILTDRSVDITLSVCVDTDLVTAYNEGFKLDDIIVLNLQGGKDFFVTVTGEFLPTCFGSSLETLVHLHKYVREVPTGQLLDLTLSSSWDEYDSNALSVRKSPPPLDIPKELYRLVQYLVDHGLKSANLFQDGGLVSEREKIRDILDTGGSEIVGSVYSVAAVLMTFLRSLREPVVPRALHQRCTDACNNPTLCKQILMQMSTVHRRTFVYLITFLKRLLEHSHENKMDAKVLASAFAEVLLNPTKDEKEKEKHNHKHNLRNRHSKKPSTLTEKRKTFVYQFLANDLTVDYK